MLNPFVSKSESRALFDVTVSGKRTCVPGPVTALKLIVKRVPFPEPEDADNEAKDSWATPGPS